VREYARIQTFPDAWQFTGSMTSQYAQIGNAVPVNLASAVGTELVRTLNEYVTKNKAPKVAFKVKNRITTKTTV
jgi:DNA (cytosine-5)-methyltransferase 1